MLFTYRFSVFGKLSVVFFILSESRCTGADWYTEICNAGMCFNGEADCLRSCNQICGEERGQGVCTFDPFIRVHICWCGYDQSETTATTSSTPLPAPTLATHSATLTESEDCGSLQCFGDRDTCDSYCLIRCHPQLYSCDLRWHGRYKCLCIQEVVVQSLP
ncbi:uncharacterized protein LOC133183588 [Saccostrea echinata]|uniref:uncharacterized protein LOC133183588 n=1 Tax=Saccostrea echinata TaxID=191078 RepID=UPI002A7F547E|nr:uncharacterized protein LOC133183588 [Saccostrea echinata]